MSRLKLKIKDLAYKCNSKNILKDICLDLKNPQVVALLGPNGAGKSTFLKALSSQLNCNQGNIVFNDHDSEKNRLKYLRHIGYMPEVACFFAELTVFEQLKLFANSKRLELKPNIDRVVSLCGLKSVLNYRTNKLSLGYRQRLNLAQAIMNQPKLLLLDEPLNGLDPLLIIEFREIIKEASQFCIVFISTHILSEAELVSDSVLFMQQGRLSKPNSENSCTQKWLAKFDHKISSKLQQKLNGFIDSKIITKANNGGHRLTFIANQQTAKEFINIIKPEDQLYYFAPLTTNLEDMYLKQTKEQGQ